MVRPQGVEPWLRVYKTRFLTVGRRAKDGTPGRIRTDTEPGLNRRPLPLGYRSLEEGEGIEPSRYERGSGFKPDYPPWAPPSMLGYGLASPSLVRIGRVELPCLSASVSKTDVYTSSTILAWCRRRESNPQAFRRPLLRRVSLPFHHFDMDAHPRIELGSTLLQRVILAIGPKGGGSGGESRTPIGGFRDRCPAIGRHPKVVSSLRLSSPFPMERGRLSPTDIYYSPQKLGGESDVSATSTSMLLASSQDGWLQLGLVGNPIPCWC